MSKYKSSIPCSPPLQLPEDTECFPPLPNHPDFIGPTAYAENLAKARNNRSTTTPEPAFPALQGDGDVPPSLVHDPDSCQSQASCESAASSTPNHASQQHDEEVYLPILQYEINAAYIDLYANKYHASPCLEDSVRYTIPTIILAYMRSKYDAKEAARGIMLRTIENAANWCKDDFFSDYGSSTTSTKSGISSTSGSVASSKAPSLGGLVAAAAAVASEGKKPAVESDSDRIIPMSTPTTTTTGDKKKKHWLFNGPLGALEYTFDLVVRIATHLSWAVAKGEAGHKKLIELIVRAREVLEDMYSDGDGEKKKRLRMKKYEDSNKKIVIKIKTSESIVPHEETVNLASFISFLVARLPCPRSTATSREFLPSWTPSDAALARDKKTKRRKGQDRRAKTRRVRGMENARLGEVEHLYNLMKYDLETFYSAYFLKGSTADFKQAMTCAMYLILAGERLWEYFVLNGHDSDWTGKDDILRSPDTSRMDRRDVPDVIETTATGSAGRHKPTRKDHNDSLASGQELGSVHWHRWMSVMYSISQEEDTDFLAKGAAVQAVRNMGQLVTIHEERDYLRQPEAGTDLMDGRRTEMAVETEVGTTCRIKKMKIED
ncbi:hypothetical protein KEM54_002747 [Ascosphaera aggregata]|nr:hypothetical protein KEM54_002747 [Ascosphaera aggregata]